MPFTHDRIEAWAFALLAAALILGISRFSVTAQAPAAPSKQPSTPTPHESGSPDAPPPPVPPSAPATNDRATSSGQMPEVEAPTIGGPSSFDSALPEAGPSRRGEPGQAPPAEEASALGGPSGGEQAAEGAAGGRDAPWWTRVPNVQPFPPPGNTIPPPRGSGYYTLLEWVLGQRQSRPPVYPYPRFGVIQFSFYNADWRYLDNPENERVHDFFDFLKRIRLGDNFLFTTGGEWRGRYNNEVDSRLSGVNNTYYTTRTRIYGDLWFRDRFRLFAEMINAQSFDQDLPPGAGDQYNPNFLNLFADAKLATIRDRPLWLRGGRQELLYGSQRLISPLDWPNSRRTFQGVKLFWQNAKWSFDGFVVQPVVPSANSFASVNWQQILSSVWGTYRPNPGQIIDLYYIDFQDSSLIYSGQNGVKGAQNVSTVGSRWYGDKNGWLWDTEAMVQFGRYSNQGLMANAFTMGGGYYFRNTYMNPSIWFYYDHASGQPGPPGTTSVHQTFNQLFPFNHYYFGMMDLVGRQNIDDYHVTMSFFPLKWWTVSGQYHILRLDSPFDALYNSSGVAIRSDPTGRAGINVGEILSIVNNFTIDLHQNVFIQYSHLYAGDFIHRTGNGRIPDYLYLMYSYRW